MPKLLVVHAGSHPDTAALADAVADGAKRVRFTEVEVRRTGGEGRHRLIEGAEAAATYDGLVIAGGLSDGVPAFLHALGHALPRPVREQKVGAAVDGSSDALAGGASQLATLGFILVPSGEPAAVGQRVAELVSAVTHMRGHQHGQSHPHSHSHSHDHGHSH